MSAHTPTPWKVFRSNKGTYIGIGESEGGGVCDAGFGVWRSGKERDANAELIVRAVNAHDDLVKALELPIIWQTEGGEHIGLSINGVKVATYSAGSPSAIALLQFEAARKAALKAKGGAS